MSPTKKLECVLKRDINEVCAEYSRIIKYTLDAEPDISHITELHKLGYLPLEIKALPEGSKVPIRVPMLTVENTDPRFFWLTNYIEALMSAELWQASTSATIAHHYRSLLNSACGYSGGPKDFVQFQGHDFSMRGMSSVESAMTSGAGHLLSFSGTDTIPAICFLEEYYGANVEKELVGTSIPATEHSVMCANGSMNIEQEFQAYKRLITEVYPKGFVSIVSDTRDLWEVLEEVIRPLRSTIMQRDGKVVIRPDSGDPVKIICGDRLAEPGSPEAKGVIQILWEIFGGTYNEKGFKELDPHIGCIYGDAITYDRCKQICANLIAEGFATTNMVYGIGSYTYQMNTRDTFGFALKSTSCTINGEEKQIFKNPKTDDGTKKSQKGRIIIYEDEYGIHCQDGLMKNHGQECLMQTIFKNGRPYNYETFATIKERLWSAN